MEHGDGGIGGASEADMGVAERDRMGRRHVVVLDSNPAVLDLVEALLREQQYNVTCSNYLDSTLDMIDVLQPDLVVVDLVWGQQAGWDLIEALGNRVSTAGVPLLLTSTDPALLSEAATNALRFGAHRTVIKPFVVSELLAAVHELAGPA